MSELSYRRAGHMRVLVVEDEQRFRELLVSVIPQMGYPAEGAGTAEEAKRMMTADAREILILDLQLPLMGGMDFLEVVRREWPHSQVIILTGFGGLEAAKRAIHLDVVEFLTKPCHLDEIEVALDRARRRAEERDAAAAPIAEATKAAETGGENGTVTLADNERRVILETLAKNGGNRTATAIELGISRRTLHYRLKEYQQEDEGKA
jgi:DNA-binding NtrC family response regulator